MDKSVEKYLKMLGTLRVDRAHGIAPHKPILLITVFQAIQQHVITDERIFITPELIASFKANWQALVVSNNDCLFALPFYHLKSSKFWH